MDTRLFRLISIIVLIVIDCLLLILSKVLFTLLTASIGLILIVLGLRRVDRRNQGWVYYYTVPGILLVIAAIITPLILNQVQRPPTNKVPLVHVPTSPSSSGSPKCDSSGTIAIDGSTAMQPLITNVASIYTSLCAKEHNTDVHINVTKSGDCPSAKSESGSQGGINELANGNIAIATSDGDDPDNKSHHFSDEVVAAVIFVLIINPTVDHPSGTNRISITNLNTDAIQKIYSGAYTNWQQLGGPDQVITAFGRESGSGTRDTFDQYVLKNSPETSDESHLYDTTNGVACNVEKTPGAIGYVTLYKAMLDLNASAGASKNLLILGSIDQHSYEDCVQDTYHFWNLEHMYTGPKPDKLAQNFVNFMGNTTYVPQIIQNDSFKTVGQMSEVLSNHYKP